MSDRVETNSRSGNHGGTDMSGHHAQEARFKANGELLFLSKTAARLLELSLEDDLYRFIATSISELVPGCMVMVSSFDENCHTFNPRASAGLGKELSAATHPIKLSVPVDDDARRQLATGRLERMPRPLSGVASAGMDGDPGTGDLHAIGFVSSGHLYGCAAVVTGKGVEVPNVAVIEAFARQASLALQRRTAEEALRHTTSVLGSDALPHVDPDDRDMVRQKATEQLKRLSDSPYQYRFLRKDGGWCGFWRELPPSCTGASVLQWGASWT